MTNLTSTLTVRLLDDVSGPAGRAAGALRGLGASGNDLKRLAAASPEMARLVRDLERLQGAAGKIQAFRQGSRALDDAGTSYRVARQDVARIAGQLEAARARVEALKGLRTGPANPEAETQRQAASADVRRLSRELRNAQGSLTASREAFAEQGQAVRAMRGELAQAGIPLKGLARAEAGIRAEIEATSKAIARQPEAMAQAAARAEAVARGAAARRAVAEGAARAEAGRADARHAAVAAIEARRAARVEARHAADPVAKPVERGGIAPADIPGLRPLLADRARQQGQLGAIQDFRIETRGLREAGQVFRQAQAQVRALKAELAAAPSDATAARLAAAQAAAVRAGEAFRAQGQAARQARAALAEAGVSVDRLRSSEAALAGALERTNGALRQQARAAADVAAAQARAAERKQVRREALGTVGAVAGVAAAHQVSHGAHAVLHTYREFDKERRFGKAVMGLTDEEQQPLVDQAYHMGATTKYNDIQVLEAQRELAARGLKKDQVLGLVNPAADLGQSLDLRLPDAVKQMEGALFGFKKPMATLEEAMASARQTADVQVKAAKVSGMTPEDITQAYKYGATPARMAGLSEQNLLAFAAISKKANMGGDESGVAFRALVANALSPTRKAKEAMLANGMDYKNYQKNPDRLDTEAFKKTVAAQYGVKLDKKTTDGIDKLFTDKKLISDPSKFTPAVMDLLSDRLSGDDAKSKKSIAGLANRFRDASMKGVDTNRLVEDLMKAIPQNNALANAIFGSKQGARIANALGDPATFKHLLEELLGHSEGYAAKISKERMAGFDGAASRLEGAIKNLQSKVGASFDNEGKGGLLTGLTNALGQATQHLAELSPAALRAGTSLLAIGAAVSGVVGAWKLTMAVFGKGAASVALTGSAAELSIAAKALDAAAVRLGASGAAGAAGAAAAPAAAAAGAGGVSLGFGGAAVLAGAVAGGALDSAAPRNEGALRSAVTGDESEIGRVSRELREARAQQETEPGRRADLQERIERERGVIAGIEGRPKGGFLEDVSEALGMHDPLKVWANDQAAIARSRARIGRLEAERDAIDERQREARRAQALGQPGLNRDAAERPAAPASVPAVPRRDALPTVLPPRRPEGLGAPAAAAARAADPVARLAPPAEPVQPTAVPTPAIDAARVAQATEALARYRQELAAVKAELAQTAALDDTGLSALNPLTAGMQARRVELEGLIAGVEAKLKGLGADTIAPPVDGSGLDSLGEKSGQVRDKLSEINATAVRPSVDSAPLDGLLGKIQQALTGLRQLSGAAASANAGIGRVNAAAAASGAPGRSAAAAPSTGVVRRAMSDSFA